MKDYSYDKEELTKVKRAVGDIDYFVKVEADISYNKDVKTTTYAFSNGEWSTEKILKVLNAVNFLSEDRKFNFV